MSLLRHRGLAVTGQAGVGSHADPALWSSVLHARARDAHLGGRGGA
jgi:hypothetical protein